VWWFLAALTMPRGVIFGRVGTADTELFLDAPDGS